MFPDKLLEIVRYVRPNSLSAAEKLRIQKYQDMCGRGLGESHFVLVTRYCTSYSIQVRYHQVKVKYDYYFAFSLAKMHHVIQNRKKGIRRFDIRLPILSAIFKQNKHFENLTF